MKTLFTKKKFKSEVLSLSETFKKIRRNAKKQVQF